MRKKVLALLLSAALVMTSITGCGSSKTDEVKSSAGADTTASAELETVKLTVWGAEEDQTMLKEMIEAFKEEYKDKAKFDISLGVESESTCKDTVLKDVESAADVYAFADDQLNELVAAKALQPITLDTDQVIEACGGSDAASVQAASSDDTLYAYPMTADNGYFMFYDKEYFSEDDVKSMDAMLDVAAKADKKVAMNMADGWYLYSFFKGAGLDLSLAEDGINNVCNWNAADTTYTGAQVTDAMVAIAKNKGFVSCADEAFVTGVKDGSIIAGVSGTWNATVAEEAWGENYAAVKLPTYTVNGEQVQMSSFAGFKLIGVNAYSKNAGYAMLLGEWLTNYDNQVKRFETRGLGPANVEASQTEEVQNSPAIAALAQQSEFATVQRIGANYWSPAETYGAIVAAGNSDGTDSQKLVDNLVDGITAEVK